MTLGSSDTAFSQMQNKMQDDIEGQPEIIEENTIYPDSDEEEDGENLNVRAAIIHMIGDMLQSAGVIIAALIIKFKPTWTIADPICTFLFSILVMFTTIPIFLDCMRILLEASPEEIETVEVYNKINEVSTFF
jgi:solute carrier family 30 (zinc transporter), member 2